MKMSIILSIIFLLFTAENILAADEKTGKVSDLRIFEYSEYDGKEAGDVRIGGTHIRIWYNENGSHKRIIAALLTAYSLGKDVECKYRGSGGYFVINRIKLK